MQQLKQNEITIISGTGFCCCGGPIKGESKDDIAYFSNDLSGKLQGFIVKETIASENECRIKCCRTEKMQSYQYSNDFPTWDNLKNC